MNGKCGKAGYRTLLTEWQDFPLKNRHKHGVEWGTFSVWFVHIQNYWCFRQIFGYFQLQRLHTIHNTERIIEQKMNTRNGAKEFDVWVNRIGIEPKTMRFYHWDLPALISWNWINIKSNHLSHPMSDHTQCTPAHRQTKWKHHAYLWSHEFFLLYIPYIGCINEQQCHLGILFCDDAWRICSNSCLEYLFSMSFSSSSFLFPNKKAKTLEPKLLFNS